MPACSHAAADRFCPAINISGVLSGSASSIIPPQWFSPAWAVQGLLSSGPPPISPRLATMECVTHLLICQTHSWTPSPVHPSYPASGGCSQHFMSCALPVPSNQLAVDQCDHCGSASAGSPSTSSCSCHLWFPFPFLAHAIVCYARLLCLYLFSSSGDSSFLLSSGQAC